ncbi:MAG: acyl-CoA dehydratase activase [Spirochaetes bacterium]|nr:acyl-CoA dehydratase activase [Spirochaetota bacterium]
MITAGIDIGSNTTKAVLMDNKSIIADRVIFTGYNARDAANEVFELAVKDAGISKNDIDKIICTGYGRDYMPEADRTCTEITCHALGARYTFPDAGSVIDIGGQDSKYILLGADGMVLNFIMNDKCAAGTGRFMEVMARALNMDLEGFANISLESENPSRISSLCSVFAESEVISLISAGAERSDISAGLHDSIASRIVAMVHRIGLKEPVIMTGGCAKNKGLVKALEKNLAIKIMTDNKTAQINGAIGAALKGMGI